MRWIFSLAFLVAFSRLLPGYHVFYPSLAALFVDPTEAQKVKRAVASRTPRDVAFFDSTDNDISDVFHDLLGPFGISRTEIKLVSTNPLLLLLIHAAKALLNRARPYQMDDQLSRLRRPLTSQTPSMPAGHAMQAYYTAGVYARRFPHLRDRLFTLAATIDETRVKAGIHYPSDGAASRSILALFNMA